MPKLVNHSERRELLADAVLTVVRRYGLARATLREVAREVGWTSGVLLHYFRDKQEMLTFAFQLATQRAGQRVERRLPGLTGIAALRAFMEETLPLDETRQLDAAIWLSFEGHVAGVPEIAEEQRTLYEGLHTNLHRLVVLAQEAGEVPSCADPDLTAARIAATIIGLRTMALINAQHYTPAFLVAVADDLLAKLACCVEESS